jgi:hypothetical protein
MNKLKNLTFEEMPFHQQLKVKGGACKCSDHCSCYTTKEKDTRVDNATDTASELSPAPLPF